MYGFIYHSTYKHNCIFLFSFENSENLRLWSEPRYSQHFYWWAYTINTLITMIKTFFKIMPEKLLRECERNFKWLPMQKWQLSIYNGTLETLIWSKMWKIPTKKVSVVLRISPLLLISNTCASHLCREMFDTWELYLSLCPWFCLWRHFLILIICSRKYKDFV